MTMIPQSESLAAQPFNLASAKNKNTLRHLLSHTSGLRYDTMDPRIQTWRKSRSEGTLTLNGNLLEAYSMPLVHEPGASWTYGSGYDWVGLLAGRLNETSFGEYCERNIFNPLQMKSCTFHLDPNPETRKILVSTSLRSEDGGLALEECGLADPAADELGGAGLYSSVPDYLKLLGDLLKDNPVTLKAKAVELLFTSQLETGGVVHKAMNEMGPVAWGFYMRDTDIQQNHGPGSMLVTTAGIESGTPRGTIRWSGFCGPIWAANHERGLAWYYATQVLPVEGVESWKRAQEVGKLVLNL
jgi:CubicO group peptidase (beta-lactamase class C family)